MTDSQSPNKPQGFRISAQYILIGAALGLYYGLFYKNPQREPDFLMVFLLSFFAALITTIVRTWKKNLPFNQKALEFIKAFGMFLLFLAAIELRAVVESLSGRTAVVIFTTLMGIIGGAVYGIKRIPPVKAKK